jgi:hypothetical protein
VSDYHQLFALFGKKVNRSISVVYDLHWSFGYRWWCPGDQYERYEMHGVSVDEQRNRNRQKQRTTQKHRNVPNAAQQQNGPCHRTRNQRPQNPIRLIKPQQLPTPRAFESSPSFRQNLQFRRADSALTQRTAECHDSLREGSLPMSDLIYNENQSSNG